MAALIEGALLNATVKTLMDKLISKEFLDDNIKNKLNVSLLMKLETSLMILQNVLDDAEEKWINNGNMFDKLKDAIFDAEDLLNQISYESLRLKVENTTQAANITNQVLNFFSSHFRNIYGDINSQMKIMSKRLQYLAQEKDILRLQSKSARYPSSSVVNESVMVGRKNEKKDLIDMLLSGNDLSHNNMCVAAIVGMGGLGKTTLAQLAYNDEKVQKHFDLKAWVCVSQDFNIVNITKTLLEYVTSKASGTNNLGLLQDELKKCLRGKRFLIVLDDLWNDNYNDWEGLVTPLINEKAGSRVIITTRQEKVAKVARANPICKLELLSTEDCWCLLSKHAFGGEDISAAKYQDLEATGRKISEKCGGLPIAAKTLGGLLRSTVDVEEWKVILKSNIWQLNNDSILPALFLSYQCLPSHLKRCFAYCSIFPKDYALDRKQVVFLWMAEGFLEHPQGEKTMEQVGNECFSELLCRSLIQQLHDNSTGQKFVMHDLVHDLATVVSGNSCRRPEYGDDISKNVRHLSYNQKEFDTFKKFGICYEFKCLRSFLPTASGREVNYLSRKVLDDLLPTFGRLRVLSLSKYYNITMLPDSIGNLVQLRYLDLSYTEIKSLPNTVCNLYFLQSLLLSNCSKLTKLPEHIGKLINLRHLDIDFTRINEMPMQILELKHLQTLTIFVVGKENIGLSVRELERFPKLRGKLCIKNLENVIDVDKARDSNLKIRKHIEELTLQWGTETDDTLKVKDVLDKLQPSPNLKKLRIDFYGGTSFPNWLGDTSFSNMVSICIDKCAYCVTLPPLGRLPSLKNLRIGKMKILETIGQEFYGIAEGGSNSSFQPFPLLEDLVIAEMPEWKEWITFQENNKSLFPDLRRTKSLFSRSEKNKSLFLDSRRTKSLFSGSEKNKSLFPDSRTTKSLFSGSEKNKSLFPSLKTLKLSNCGKLKGHLPCYLPCIEKIEIYNCEHLSATRTGSTLHWLSSIKKIVIERSQCSLLASDSSCVREDIEIIQHRPVLESVPKTIMKTTCLQYLNLNDIPSLTEFPADGLPTSLKSLRIHDCENLKFLPLETWSNYKSLVRLGLKNSCGALKSFPLNGFPMLQDLFIENCKGLESIFISETSSFSSSTLQYIFVYGCEELRSLPQQMNSLTALGDIYLSNLPNLNFSFCDGACLPPKLQSLCVDSERMTVPVTEWSLQGLTSLLTLVMGGDDIVTMLLKGQKLPTSLVYLTIQNLSETKSLEGRGLQHLGSLEDLIFLSCSKLESFPENTLPPSLISLSYSDCPRLESLPEDSLPYKLELLCIFQCQMLEERYKSEEHRSKIARIPVIMINEEVII